MSALCGPACGYCGRCTAVWEDDEPDEREDDDEEIAEQSPSGDGTGRVDA